MFHLRVAVAADRQSRRAAFSKTRQLIIKYNKYYCDTVMVIADVYKGIETIVFVDCKQYKKLYGDVQELCGSLGRL